MSAEPRGLQWQGWCVGQLESCSGSWGCLCSPKALSWAGVGQGAVLSILGGSPWAAGGSVLHHGPHGLQRLPRHSCTMSYKGVCSAVWSTSCCLLHWPWCLLGCFSHIFSDLSLTEIDVVQEFFSFLNLLPQWCYHLHGWAQPWPVEGLSWKHGLCWAEHWETSSNFSLKPAL